MNNVVKCTPLSKITFFVIVLLTSVNSFGQNTNLENLLSSQQWDDLFPHRAGTYGVHPQGYTSDFYSYENLIQAAEEMSDYQVEIRIKVVM